MEGLASYSEGGAVAKHLGSCGPGDHVYLVTSEF